MAKDTAGRISKTPEQEIKEMLDNIIRSYKAKGEEEYKTFLKHSHGVYRDEVKQYESEVKGKMYNEFVDSLQELREDIYVRISKQG